MFHPLTRFVLLALACCIPVVGWSQEAPLPPGIKAGIEAYQEGEFQRRSAVQQQVELNRALRYPLPWSTPFGETIYYSGYAPPGFGAGFYGYSSYSPYYLGRFGYGYPPPNIRQPIGQRQVQTGPRRWESFPVYEEDLVPAASPRIPLAASVVAPPEPMPPKPRTIREF